MRVFVDADGCPVTDITAELCRRFQVPCCIVCDTAHEFHIDSAETVVVDQGADSADYAIANRIRAGDLVITQDYGLASMCLARQARVLHQNGWEYTEDNIGALLFERHESRKLRASGKHLKGPSRRKPQQNQQFRDLLESILQQIFQG